MKPGIKGHLPVCNSPTSGLLKRCDCIHVSCLLFQMLLANDFNVLITSMYYKNTMTNENIQHKIGLIVPILPPAVAI